ncbi:site-specific integrase [Phytoactinopolyspora halotolerans]|uniref:Site-specific integrase n=1 Tax=Phytoactinopolyspora halotolerans TaxID=1981512 RepID=A0A6L9S239_9ACTN|nr:site-specific integrase [Phytoactinopolyspora halotolerans]NED99285.1 site-specific integrase [Phytoactinopolyspora halotolerans]
MGRPPLPVGTAGTIGFTRMNNGTIRARALFRDYDGMTRPVTRYGPSKAAAERRLKEALRDRRSPTDHDQIAATTRVRDLAIMWLAEIDDADLSDGTKDLYRRTLTTHVLPALGALQISECDVPTVDRYLKAVRTNQGPAAAKTAKTVTSLLLGMAVRHGALPANPVTNTAKIPRGTRKRPRALTLAEESEVLAKFRADKLAAADDIVDLTEFMLGTGLRIGEALGVRATVVDLDAGVLEVNAKATYKKGHGAVLEERPKTAAGWRVIALPDHIVELCRRRTGITRHANEHDLLFPTRTGGVRLPTNADRALRKALDRIGGYDWVTSHTFRKTVATRLDQAGLTAREIADHLGHEEPSMTQNVYMGRGVASTSAAAVLGPTK